MRRLLINLPERNSRLAIMEAQLATLGWAFELVPGIRPSHPGKFQTPGIWGCAMAHLVAGLMASESEPTLVMEDDVVFRMDAQDLLAAALMQISECEWDILHLGILHASPSNECRIAPNLVRFTAGLHLHAYILNPERLSRVRDVIFRLLNYPQPCHLDEFLNDEANGLARFSTVPTLAIQAPGFSDTMEIPRSITQQMFWSDIDAQEFMQRSLVDLPL